MITSISLVGRTRFELVTNGLKARYSLQASASYPMEDAASVAPEVPETPHGWQKASCTSPRLLQDETQTADSKKLSQWFASRPDARRRAREAAEEITKDQE